MWSCGKVSRKGAVPVLREDPGPKGRCYEKSHAKAQRRSFPCSVFKIAKVFYVGAFKKVNEVNLCYASYQ